MPTFIGSFKDLASTWHDVDVEQLLLRLPISQNPKTQSRSENLLDPFKTSQTARMKSESEMCTSCHDSTQVQEFHQELIMFVSCLALLVFVTPFEARDA